MNGMFKMENMNIFYNDLKMIVFPLDFFQGETFLQDILQLS